jgi:hypothetical protein
VLPLVNIQSYWASLVTVPSPLVVLDFASVALLFVTAAWALRRLPAEYGLYTLLLVVMPLANGQVWGVGRGALGAFPVFLMLASLATPARRAPMLIFGTAWATVMGLLFVNGHAVG